MSLSLDDVNTILSHAFRTHCDDIDKIYDILLNYSEHLDNTLSATNLNILIRQYINFMVYKLPHVYKKSNKLKYYIPVCNLLHKSDKIKDHVKKQIFEEITKCMHGQRLLYNFDDSFLTTFITTQTDLYDYINIASNEGTLPTLLYWLNKVNIYDLPTTLMNDIITGAFFNSDDRVYKYLININVINSTTLKYIIDRVIQCIFSRHISDKYKLRRLKALSTIINIDDHIFKLIEFSPNYIFMKKIIKYYYTKPFSNFILDWQTEANCIYDMMFVYCSININSLNSNLEYIYNILKTNREKNIFVFYIFLRYYSIFNFPIIPTNVDYNYLFEKLFNINISYILSTGSYASYSLKNIMTLFNHDIVEKTILKKKLDKIFLEIYGRKIFLMFPYIRCFNTTDKTFISYNRCLYYLKIYIRRKRRLRKMYQKIKLTPIINELKNLQPTKPVFKIARNFYNTKKQKFNNIPPYNLLPNQLDNLYSSFFIKEKADGILVNDIPHDIYPKYYFRENIKAEYIEDLDLYLVFDIELNATIEDRYNHLRNYHHSTKNNSNIMNINTFDELVDSINKERKIFTQFLAEPYEIYRWYPKAAWKINRLNKLFQNKLYDLVNSTSKDDYMIKWLCNNGPVKNDGLILTPLNGDREIKLKPKYLMSIDLLYKNNTWIDRNNYKYHNIINKNKVDLIDDTIWRCYPDHLNNNNFIPCDIRYDKRKPNPRNVVDNIINLIKIKFTTDSERLYYSYKRYYNNTKWKDIVNTNNSIIKDRIGNNNNSLSWLDLGCGKGKLLQFISNYKSYYGIDYDNNVLVKANQKYNNNRNSFNYIDLSKKWNDTKNKWLTISFQKKYDIIIATNSIMHFYTDIFLQQLDKVVKKDTKFIFNVVSMESIGPNGENKYEFGNSYIYLKDNFVKYYFEPIHKKEMIEPFISHKDIKDFTEKYDWRIIDIYRHDSGLANLYTWYTLVKN